jgi:hypothetical protein
VKEFVVNSAILQPSLDPIACAVAALKMLAKEGIKNVKIKNCYCCGLEGKAVFIIEGESKEAVLDAWNKINLPIASNMEAEEVTPK